MSKSVEQIKSGFENAYYYTGKVYDCYYDPEIYYFDEFAANKAVAFFETQLYHSIGEKAGELFILSDWQRQIVRDVAGWKYKDDGSRKYRTVFIFVPRKQGKSTFAAGWGLYLLYADGEKGVQVYGAASTEEQAKIVFRQAVSFVNSNEEMGKRSDAQKTVLYKLNDEPIDTFYSVVSSNPSASHGFNPHGVVIDELHVHKNSGLFEGLTTAQGSRKQPLTVIITTAGDDVTHFCHTEYEKAKDVRDGKRQIDSLYPAIFEGYPTDDITDELNWKLANPNLGVSVSLKYLRKEAQNALGDARLENSFKRLYLNLWSDSVVSWRTTQEWRDTCDESEYYDWDKLEGLECFIGVDLSDRSDITALTCAFFLDDQKIGIKNFFIMPRRSYKKALLSGRGQFAEFAKSNIITVTENNVVDLDEVVDIISTIHGKMNIVKVVLDRWNSHHIVTSCEARGIETMLFGQGYKDMAPAITTMDKYILDKDIVHNGDPVLEWMIGNAMIQSDEAGNRKFTKKKSKDKIDGVISCTMAVASLENYKIEQKNEVPCVYESRGVTVIG